MFMQSEILQTGENKLVAKQTKQKKIHCNIVDVKQESVNHHLIQSSIR